MTECFLIRHAHAGTRGAFADNTRELTDRGRAQAGALADRLTDFDIRAVITSPFTRCVQTVEPLAQRLGITMEISSGLAEGAGTRDAIEMIEHAQFPLALCSHGDVIGDTMHALNRRGVVLDDNRVAKGSVWILTVADGTVTTARYVHPTS